MIGAGNPLFGDDALGYCVARILEECTRDRGFDVVALQALEPGAVAYFEGHEPVVIVDAVDPDSLPEGARIAVYEVEPWRLSRDELAELLTDISSHESNPVNLAVLGFAAGTLSSKLVVVGLRPYRIELGVERLSREACSLLLPAARKVLEVVGGGEVDAGCAASVARVECGCE